ncbi:MAG: SRPBCC family protein, partial [Acidobacteriota bacterium]
MSISVSRSNPDKVYALIAAPANGASWRHNVKSVNMLAPTAGGQQRWVEDLGHGQTMKFLAVASDPPNKREVSLDVPGAAYGGSWIYELSAGPKANTTTLTITEAGFIRPPLYRFLMHHVIGLTANLDQYLADVQKSFPG